MSDQSKPDAPTQSNLFVRYLPVIAALLLIVVCTLPRWSAVELPGGQRFWKITYAVFLSSALLVLWPASSRWLAERWSIFKPQRAPDAWWWFDAMAFTYTVIPIMQYTLPLPRPPGTSLPDLGGFPSGHQVSVFALSWLIWRSLPRLSAWWFGVAVFMGWARISTHDHYAYQVLSGAAVGTIVGWASAHFPEGVLLPRVWHWAQGKWKKRSASTSK